MNRTSCLVLILIVAPTSARAAEPAAGNEAKIPEWNVRLRISPGQERDVKMHRQWPMLRAFSESKPNEAA